MHTENDHAVRVLNRLIETTLDSANGYREAAEHSVRYSGAFSERASSRLDLARQLQQEVRTFGGEPEDDQSIIGKAHNKWVDLKNALVGGPDDQAVVNEVERGEDVIKARFEDALRDEDLPAATRATLMQAYTGIKADHDQVSHWKHELAGRN